ncbi:Potassium transporter 11 [Abeliophyllum distichum]|uniref:Potassium transporter 11 n=1 Tax=Abeliophyllum distichum TaxID=126358 RepID=A0ABD1QEY3_9LAMI
MESWVEFNEGDETKGNMWVLEQKLDQPMDDEHVKVKTIPNQHCTGEELMTYSHSTFHDHSFAAKTKRWLEAHAFRKNALLILVLIGTCTMIGDGILTHAISVKPPHRLALGCFPIVKVVHTSKKFLGQIYIPDMNWILMILYIAVTAGFRNKRQIGNAYGIAVVIVMLVTTFLMILIMLLVWSCQWIIVLIFTGFSLVVECTYFSTVLFKVDHGGWVPLVISAAFFVIMYVWHYGTIKRYAFEMHIKVSMAWILGLGPSLGLVRVPGIGLVCES